MERPQSTIVFSSGAYSSIGLFPHLIFLMILFFSKAPAPLVFLIMSHLAAIFLGEYLFCGRIFPNLSVFDWLKWALHPIKPGYVLTAYVSELMFDGIFLFLAIKFGWNPLHFFLILLGCKFVSAPIQVFSSYFYLSKNTSYALAVFTQVILLFISYGNPNLFIYTVILKGLLCNGIAVARSQYALEASA